MATIDEPAPQDRIDPDAWERRMRAVLGDLNPADRVRAIVQMAESFHPEHWEEALDAILEIRQATWGDEVELLIAGWVECDPVGAWDWAVEGDAGLLSSVIRAWTLREPRAVVEHIMNSPSGSRVRVLLLSRALESLSHDPDVFCAMLETIPDGDRTMVLQQARIQPGNLSRDQCRRWLERIDPEFRRNFVLSVLRSLRGLEKKRTWIDAYPGEVPPGVQSSLYQDWIVSDPGEAEVALGEIESSAAKSSAIFGAARGLINSGHPSQAFELIERYEENVDDQALVGVIQYFLPEDSGEFRLVAGSLSRIRDAGQRLRMSRYVLSSWKRKDPIAMEEWMMENDVPGLVRRALEE